jgi:hypothetical protein
MNKKLNAKRSAVILVCTIGAVGLLCGMTSCSDDTLSDVSVTQSNDVYENDNNDCVKSCFSVVEHYTVSGDKSVSDFTVSLDTSTTGTASATITYGTMTKTVDVAVKESNVSISDSYDRIYVGDTLTNKFSITYDGSRTATINSVTIDGGTTIPDSSTGTILVSYTLPTKTTSASDKTYEKAISIIQKITMTIKNNTGKRIKITGETSGTSVTIKAGQQAEGTFDIGEKLLIKNITENDKIPTADYETNNITSENTSMSIKTNDDADKFIVSM